MSKRKLVVLGTAALSVSALVLGATPAFAAGGNAVLTYGGLGSAGTNVATTNTLAGALASGTTNNFTFNDAGTTVTITCTKASFKAKATSNPTAPGTAKLSITTLTFNDGTTTQCSLTGLTGITVASVKLKSAAVGNVTDNPKDLNITSLNEVVTLNSPFGAVTCDYGTGGSVSNIQGAITNPGSTGSGGKIVFSKAPVDLISGSSACGTVGSTGTFTATFGSIKDSSVTGTNKSVYVN